MKKYLCYAIVIGFLGNSLLSTASNAILTNKSVTALELMGE